MVGGGCTAECGELRPPGLKGRHRPRELCSETPGCRPAPGPRWVSASPYHTASLGRNSEGGRGTAGCSLKRGGALGLVLPQPSGSRLGRRTPTRPHPTSYLRSAPPTPTPAPAIHPPPDLASFTLPLPYSKLCVTPQGPGAKAQTPHPGLRGLAHCGPTLLAGTCPASERPRRGSSPELSPGPTDPPPAPAL